MSDLILGVSAYFHDSAAALVADGVPVAAAQEERFSRRRHDPAFPTGAVQYCLREADANLGDVSAIAYYEDPRLKLSRVLWTFAGVAPRGFEAFHSALPEWLRRKRRPADSIRRELAALREGPVPGIMYRRHHESHAASAFLPSPYRSAAVLCVDGVGEWATTTIWHGQGSRLRQLAELRFPHSLGMLYSAFTYFCGFKVNSGEYKLMGLAPYGSPRYEDLIYRELIDVKDDGSFRLNMRYFTYLSGQTMTGTAFEELFRGPRREPESPLTEREFDLAASVQKVTDRIMLLLARTARRLSGESKLCLAGGVALNCVANGKIADHQIFDEIWIQPAAGDAGGALGAALALAMERGSRRDHVDEGRDAMAGALLGPSYGDEEVQAFLDGQGVPYIKLDTDELIKRVAVSLADGKVVGWFQGRTEYGPRALGSRSILGDPRKSSMQSTMNLKIKFRESFRPFAPSVLAEDARDYFQLRHDSPYMLMVADIAPHQRRESGEAWTATGPDLLRLLRLRRSTIPAVTHVDNSARIQTVSEHVNPTYHQLLTAFKELTGCPVLVNTSFNVRGEPIVNTPREAYACFMRTDIDTLAMGNFLLNKVEQPQWEETRDWREEIPLD